MIDPNGVYLKNFKGQPNFRVLAAQRLKSLGVRCVGCFNDTDDDVLQDRVSGRIIKLTEEGQANKSILVLSTQKVPKFPITSVFRQIVADISKGNRTSLVTSISDAESVTDDRPAMIPEKKLDGVNNEFDTPLLLFDVAKCLVEERSRL